MSSNLKANCCGLSTGYRKLSFPSLSFPSVGCRKPKKVGKHWFRLSMKRFSMFSITRLYVRDYFSSFCVTTRSQRLHFKLRWSSSRVNISGCHWCKPINWAVYPTLSYPTESIERTWECCFVLVSDTNAWFHYALVLTYEFLHVLSQKQDHDVRNNRLLRIW